MWKRFCEVWNAALRSFPFKTQSTVYLRRHIYICSWVFVQFSTQYLIRLPQMHSNRFCEALKQFWLQRYRSGKRFPQDSWEWTLSLQSIFKYLVHGASSVLFGLIYSVLMSQRHAGHWSSIPVSVSSWNFWQREMTIRPCMHLPRQKVMRLCCWKYHYKASGLHLGLTAPSNSAACQLACLACLLQKKWTKTIRIRDRETAREAPHAETNEHARAFHPESD